MGKPVRCPLHDGAALQRDASVKLWDLGATTSAADRAYVLVTPGPDGPGAVPDGRCGLGLVDGVLWWFGPQTRPWLPERAGVRVVGIRLALLAGRQVAGQSLRLWRDRRAPLGELWDAGALDHLAVRMRAAAEDEDQIDLLVAAATQLVRPMGPDALLQRLADLVTQDLPVAEVALRLGVSIRGVHQRCVDAFGVPPSVLRRTVRLHRTARLHAAGGPGQRLADLAQTAGYADQAHLSREMRSLTGLTPQRALRGSLPIHSRRVGSASLWSEA